VSDHEGFMTRLRNGVVVFGTEGGEGPKRVGGKNSRPRVEGQKKKTWKRSREGEND